MTKKEKSRIPFFEIIVLVISITFITLTIATGGEIWRSIFINYDNPNDCKEVWHWNLGNSSEAPSFMYMAYEKAGNCYGMGYEEGNYYLECCKDEGVRYKK